jgi:DNA replication protein DnaC
MLLFLVHRSPADVGYLPFKADAANLFFQVISACYERASVIVTSNKSFGCWGETFGDATVAAQP